MSREEMRKVIEQLRNGKADINEVLAQMWKFEGKIMEKWMWFLGLTKCEEERVD